MAGIRNFKSNVPHVFRYPEWIPDLYYPSGSVVSVEIIDSDVIYDFYAAKKDVTDLKTWPPGNSSEWRRVHDVERLDSDLIQKIASFDSDKSSITQNADSDRHDFKADDSDIRLQIDSEEIARRNADSDLGLRLDSDKHDWKAADSDLRGILGGDLDKEIHDRAAGDSDIRHTIRGIDSDLAILFARTDSDEDAIQALYTALVEGLDSEIALRFNNDSEIKQLIVKTVHDYLANDSEFDSDINALKYSITSRLDSDFKAAVRGWTPTGVELPWGPQPFVSNTDFFIDSGTITNHTTGTLWLVDHQQGWIYIIRDGVVIGDRAPGDLLTTTVYTGIAGNFTRGTQITDGGGGADVNVYQAVGDPLPLVTNANLYTVAEATRERAFDEQAYSMDDALRRTVNTVIQIDSDLHELMYAFDSLDSDNDSDHTQFRHDILELDSDVQILMRDRDSDNQAVQHLQISIDSEEHARRAADSDLIVLFSKMVDSDVRLTLEHDSELFAKTDSEEIARRNADSDIYNGYHSVSYRYVKPEYTAANIIGVASLSYNPDNTVQNIANFTGGWVWNSWNNYLTIVDSDGVVLYNAQHDGEPIEVSDRVNNITYIRGTDTLQDTSIQLNGVHQQTNDIWNFRIEYVSKKPFFGAKIVAYTDSDLTLHEADSDNTKTLEWLGEWLYRSDSDLALEEHDRKAVDSDIIAEFRKVEQTFTLVTGTDDYTITEWELNEIVPWDFDVEIFSNGSIYRGIENNHFEINHDGTAWTITVDGVQDKESAFITVTGTATVSGANVNVPWDDSDTVTITPLNTDSTADIAALLNQALINKRIQTDYTVGNNTVTYSTEGRYLPEGPFTINGITFTYTQNVVTDLGLYYKNDDTITIRKK